MQDVKTRGQTSCDETTRRQILSGVVVVLLFFSRAPEAAATWEQRAPPPSLTPEFAVPVENLPALHENESPDSSLWRRTSWERNGEEDWDFEYDPLLTGSPPNEKLETIFQRELRKPGIVYGAAFDGPSSFVHNDTTDFIPASIVKLLSAALALETLGPDFRFETRLLWRHTGSHFAYDVQLLGSGDPTFGLIDFEPVGRSRLRDFVRAMADSGVREVRGMINLHSIDARWDRPVHADGVEPADHMQCYGALSQAFNYAGNCAGLQITSRTTTRWLDASVEVPVETQITAGSSTALTIKPKFAASGETVGFIVRGTWANKRRAPVGFRVPVPNAKAWVRNLFIEELKRAGIVYRSEPLAPVAGEAHIVSTYSPPLREILIPVLKESDNFVADAVFKRSVIARNTKPTSPLLESAQYTFSSVLAAWANEARDASILSDFSLLDGAGLSRSNRATPRSMLAALKLLATKPYFAHLWHAMAVAGTDGTLKKRLRGDFTRGIVRGKTGTVRGSYQLAGFVPHYRADGKIDAHMPFVILTATQKQFQSRVRALQERALVSAVLDINPALPPPQVRSLEHLLPPIADATSLSSIE